MDAVPWHGGVLLGHPCAVSLLLLSDQPLTTCSSASAKKSAFDLKSNGAVVSYLTGPVLFLGFAVQFSGYSKYNSDCSGKALIAIHDLADSASLAECLKELQRVQFLICKHVRFNERR